MNNEEKIWSFLKSKINNDFGVAGLMGNLFAESGLRPDNLQNSYEKSLGLSDTQYSAAVNDGSYTNFIEDKAGYGLAQWTYHTRKQKLLEFARQKGKPIDDLDMQLEFLWKELSEGYAGVLTTLQTTTSIFDASNAVLLNFEKPADQSATVQLKRARFGQTFFDKFAKKEITKTDNNYTQSHLIDCIIYSPNHSGQRTHKIDRITPHCVVGQLSAESIAGCFINESRKASCNYGIGFDGRVSQIVDENNRSWCSSSAENDQRAITIEVASDTQPPYAFKPAAYNKLIELCADICKRYGKKKLLWIEDKDMALTYEPKSDEMLLTVHRWFANKSCPGDWMYERMGDLANKVTAKLGYIQTSEKQELQPNETLYRVQIGAYIMKVNADAQLAKVKAAGFSDAFITKVDNLYKVQIGAYNIKKNADNMLANIKNKGFNAFITTDSGTQIPATSETKPYIVKVTVNALNIRKGPGTNYDIVGCIRDHGVYTIVEEQDGWGCLKSGKGWICLTYTEKR